MRSQENPHTLKAYAKGIDLIPYIAVLAVPFVWAIWAMGVHGNADQEELAGSWWFAGYLAILLYAPSMALCGLLDWVGRRRNWRGVVIGARLARWTHFCIALGPVIVLVVAAFIPTIRQAIL